jgi:riboflavin kinase/FMN adenylyltransferase
LLPLKYNFRFFALSSMRIFHGFRRPVSSPLPAALSIGNFDGVHRGHGALLAELIGRAREGGMAATVMTFEPHPREFFTPDQAPARLATLREKLLAFAAAGIDEVCVVRFDRAFAALSADAFAEKVLCRGLRARHVIVGDDFRFGAGRLGTFSDLSAAGRALGFTVSSMDTVRAEGARVSSSAIRAALGAGDLARAKALLGRPYAMSGRVMHGEKLGRRLGFPTANIFLRHMPLALSGVFAARVILPGGDVRMGVANLGMRPTLTGSRPVLETHLFDFHGDLYGAHMTVEFAAKLRAERKFPDLAALGAQIAEDARQASSFFDTVK